MKLTKTTLLGAFGALSIMATAATSFAVEPINIRWASDHSGPPHPAAIAEAYFADVVEAKIPGSKVQVYWAKSLYTVPGAMEALSDGNLEMMTGQFGKGASIDPYVNVLIGAGKLTTPGAINAIETTKTYQFIKDRFDKLNGIKVFGHGHMSMYMGVGGVKQRLIAPEDFKGLKIRSMGPAENALLGGLGASPTTMSFGDVPSALQTGVIDGLLTSLGGFNATKEQAPYFTVAGINGIVGDYYFIAAGNKWWNTLKKDQQAALQDIIVNDFIPYQKAINFCNDKRMVDMYQVTDKSKPGIYIFNEAESAALNAAEGGATTKWIKSKVDDAGDKLADQFIAEAKQLVKANPLGSSAVEKTDCSAFAKDFNKYKKAKKRL
jgi:TRAP-type C4-dicarboxylate transport system substrate-binding protein